MSETPISVAGSNNEEVVEEQENKEKGKKRKTTSKVWDDMTKFTINGVKKAKCNHCGGVFSLSTSSATTHLTRHLKTCAACAAAKSGNQGTYFDELLLLVVDLVTKHLHIGGDHALPKIFCEESKTLPFTKSLEGPALMSCY